MKYLALMSLATVLTACGLKEAKLRDQQNIQNLIAQRGPELNRCYETALRKDPKLESGSITLKADQNIDGSLHSTRLIRGFSASNQILDCVTETVNSWKTEAPSTRGPITITWKFENSGALRSQTRSDFESKLKAHEEDFKACYKRYVQSASQPEWGKIRFRFLRKEDGRLSELTQIDGFRGSDQVFTCMSRIMESWQLAEGSDSQRITWSYQFSPELN